MRLEVLIADSENRSDKIVDSIRASVNRAQYIVTGQTLSLDEAFEVLSEGTCDIMVVINRSPNYIAARLLRHMSSLEARIPVIVVSDIDDSPRMRECFLLGAVDYLSCPLDSSDMNEALSRAGELVHDRSVDDEYRRAVDESLSAVRRDSGNAELLDEMEEFLIGNRQQPATVEMAADHMGLNKDYFGRYFKNKTGMTFGEFYKGFQIRYACNLLETGHFKVQDISSLLGFYSADYFTRVFKRYTGRLPSEYRRVNSFSDI